MKDLFIEAFMWWVDWIVDGQVYDMILRIIATVLFIGVLGFAFWVSIWGEVFHF